MSASKLNDEITRQLVQLVEAGNYLDVAATAVGISRNTYSRWRRQGRDLVEMYPDLDPEEYPEDIIPAGLTEREWGLLKFTRQLDVAEAKAESYAVLMVRKQMPEQWTAAMTFLERRHPDRWRKRQTLDLPGQSTGGIDERALIEDPRAVHLLHEALEQVAKGQIEGAAVDLEQQGQKKLPAPIPEDQHGE